MGREKELVMEQRENSLLAAAYLVRLGKLEHCAVHQIFYGGDYSDLETDFWKKVMTDRKLYGDGPITWADDLESRELTDLLKHTYEVYSVEGCAQCDKLMTE